MTSEEYSNPIMMALQYPHKKFSSIGPFVDVSGKIKYCISCGNMATKEAIFTAYGVSILEKYCDSCAKKNIP
ncbi:MAG TPA: hypothetical protein VFG45_07515 [Candidatus Nitrosocosmicus sp.]|jgi:hypothetical protein|nr:hypothetical protein [Candidatus Nitrosocosmicus sp.]